jgi:hypothetical protein
MYIFQQGGREGDAGREDVEDGFFSFDYRENNKQICRPTGTPSLAPQFVMARVPSSWWTHVNY